MTAEVVEDIPNEHTITRANFEVPGQNLAPESYFRFGYDKDRDEKAESFFWRKYAPLISEIHQKGCALEPMKRQRNPTITYVGARSATAGEIRKIESDKGHKLLVYHFEENGDRAHCHVAIEPAPGTTAKNMKGRDVTELAVKLVRVLSALEPHSCKPD